VRNILDEEERLEAYVKNLQAMRCLEQVENQESL
jgi:hypothetical protein